MEVEMKMVKSLLLGTAAGFVAVAGAQAADMPVKAKPVQYVKICSLYGDGFYYIPGTDTCLKLGGYLRVQAEYNMGAGGIPIGSGPEATQGKFTRTDTNDINFRTRAALSWDVRQQTEYGTLRTYIRIGVQQTTPADVEGGVVFWDRAFMQFAGFTVGKTQSFFDLFTYGGAYSYHNVRVSGDTGAAGITVWAYTAQFGNGFSGTLSLESLTGHNRQPVVDASVANFFAINGGVVGDTAFGIQTAANNGFRMPDVVVNLRVDQAWGFAGISGAIHEATGQYWNAPLNPFANNVGNGHPNDKLGWALAAGAKFNLQGGDMVGFNACYSEGAAGFCTNEVAFQLYNASSTVGVGWLSDGIFDVGTEVQLTRVWSALAAYEHIWNPKWRTSWFGGYVNVSYNDTAKTIINSHLPAVSLLGGVCGPLTAATNPASLTTVIPAAGNSCSPNYSFFEIGSRTQWNPVPQLDIGLEVLYTKHNTAFKGPGVYAINLPKPAITVFDDQEVWSAMFRWQRNFYP
jgi:Porin subfamily